MIALQPEIVLQLSINSDGPPRRGAFEVAITTKPSDDVEERNLIWTGLKRTPRAQKFPDAAEMTEIIKKFLKLTSAESPTNDDVKTEVEETSKGEKSAEKEEEQGSTTNDARSKLIKGIVDVKSSDGEDKSLAKTSKQAKRGRSKKK